MRRVVIVAVAALAFASGPATAQTMYKWKDEKGVTHFSEEPPPDGKAQRIEVKPTPPSTTPPPATKPGELNRRALDLRDQRLGKAEREAAEKREAEQRRVQCQRAQRDLDVLRRERPVYSLNERGERVYVDDKNRAAEIQQAQRQVDATCR